MQLLNDLFQFLNFGLMRLLCFHLLRLKDLLESLLVLVEILQFATGLLVILLHLLGRTA